MTNIDIAFPDWLRCWQRERCPCWPSSCCPPSPTGPRGQTRTTSEPDTGADEENIHGKNIRGEIFISDGVGGISPPTPRTADETASPASGLIDKELQRETVTFYIKIFTWKTFTKYKFLLFRSCLLLLFAILFIFSPQQAYHEAWGPWGILCVCAWYYSIEHWRWVLASKQAGEQGNPDPNFCHSWGSLGQHRALAVILSLLS